MPVYPVNLQLTGRHCAVVGGGSVAERKVGSLLAAKAQVAVISPDLTPELRRLQAAGRIVHVAEAYRFGMLQQFFIVICATNRTEVNRAAAEEAKQAGALVNVVDDAELSDFTVPAQVVRGDLLLTVSTGGKSPGISRLLREELAGRYGAEYGLYLDLVAALRDRVKEGLDRPKDREVFWRQAFDQEILALLKQGKVKEAEEKIEHAAGCSGIKS
ncbi:hypothetical protein P22_1822 [Propionispora sp. 2/2-37]|uniref:precorrin-2 dehydrogenase/sirohydrochlorin ferrochelatase family protein n=1 Tax=Propionispora sp. 2/2-37 TaxID=1677858 RepID=UPI0006BB70A4|nr:bifunctional precorrin-2 dehydrogenase/sirohydrochlorin ferrochelatase [Propionispora sp. 2/2-37]CUH95742.1 hypothetical protein P22_1822 [Propionispora sp. 2/2-37]